MDRLIALQQRIAPELSSIIELRYSILRNIHFSQPIGRRAMALRLKTQERVIRREIDFLRDAGMVEITGAGMHLTAEGEEILRELREYIRTLRGLSYLERSVAEVLGLQEVIVVSGDSDDDESVKKELAKAAAYYIKKNLKDDYTIAVTGGTTMAEVARAFAPSRTKRNVTVVPARGSLGEEIEQQSDTVAVAVAKGLGGSYRLLNLPDDLSEDIASQLVEEPRIYEVVEQIRNADMVVHGIGTAEEMARRRRLPEEQARLLRRLGAVGEAFGFYFDRNGSVVHTTPSLGLKIEDLSEIEQVIAVGGGRTKAEAIIAVSANNLHKALITDEGASRRILALTRGRNRPARADAGLQASKEANDQA
ncbi:MAG: sugar-binding domain-containing protein [Bacillota bacterium]